MQRLPKEWTALRVGQHTGQCYILLSRIHADRSSKLSKSQVSPKAASATRSNAVEATKASQAESQAIVSVKREVTAQRLVSWDLTHKLDENSKILLSHFIGVTGPQTIARKPAENALLTHILPMAYQDNMIMSALLAYSGAHVSYRTGNSSLKSSALAHYYSASRHLGTSLGTIQESGSFDLTLRSLATSVLLYHFEVSPSEKSGQRGQSKVVFADPVPRISPALALGLV